MVGIFSLLLLAGCGKEAKPSASPAAPVTGQASPTAQLAPPEETHDVDVQSFVGKPLAALVKAYGKPSMTTTKGKTVSWFYSGFTVLSKDGKTVSSVKMDEGHLELDTSIPSKPAAPANVPDFLVTANGGQTVNLDTIAVPGKITIIDFYAEWCGPCQRIGPELVKLASADEDVILRKIDIVNWDSPVVKQLAIQSVPNVRVIGKDGKQVGETTSSLDAIVDYIAQAKK